MKPSPKFCLCLFNVGQTDTIHTMSTVIALTSDEVAIGETLNEHRDLYNAVSKHEQRLLRCVRDLAKLVAQEEKVDFDEDFWLGFHSWANDPANVAKATGFANSFVSKFLKDKGDAASAGHTLGLYVGIWHRWGINISATVKEQIASFRREVWKPKDIARHGHSRNDKAKQYDSVEPIWGSMVNYLVSTSAVDFRTHLRSLVNNRGSHEGVAESSFQEMNTVANKSDEGLLAVMRCTLAYASLLRSTGMRSITGLDLKLIDFETLDGGEVLLTRVEHKVGSVRNCDKTVYAKIVPAKDPTQCTLVHLARYFVGAEQLPVNPFTLGFTRKHGKERTDFSKPVQTRYISLLNAVAIACGLPNGLSGSKKLHLFRVMSENVLATRGARPTEREDFIGWTNSVQSSNYSVLKVRAKQSNCPYLLAGREDKDAEQHAMWDLFGDVPVEEGNHWQRVYYLAVAAKVVKDISLVIDDQFQHQMDAHLKSAAKRRATSTNPVALNKRIRELERELQFERTKRAKVDLLQQDTPPTDTSSDSETNSSSDAAPTIDPPTALKELVTTLKADRKLDLFPSQCLAALPRLTSLIDANATPQRSFGGLALSSAEGKDLVRCLYLAALAKRVQKPDKEAARSWLGFIDQQKKRHPVLKAVDMKSWAAYRSTL